MTKIKTLFAGLTLALAPCLTTPCAAATAYLARNGTGAACTSSAPCTSMASAIAAAGTNGEVICFDKGNYGGVLIQNTVTISCGDGLWEVPSEQIFVQTTASSKVSIEGLVIDGSGFDGSSLFLQGSGLFILNRVRVGNHLGANSDGLLFQPNGAGKLQVTDSVFYSNGMGTGGGIVVRPQGPGTAQVSLEHVIVTGNVFGIAADGSLSTGGINMTIADSVISNNLNDGIIATTPAGHAPIGVLITNTKSVYNAFGVRSVGPNVSVRLNNSDIAGNGTGLNFGSGGALFTFGNNRVRANAVDGTFSAPLALQ